MGREVRVERVIIGGCVGVHAYAQNILDEIFQKLIILSAKIQQNLCLIDRSFIRIVKKMKNK